MMPLVGRVVTPSSCETLLVVIGGGMGGDLRPSKVIGFEDEDEGA